MAVSGGTRAVIGIIVIFAIILVIICWYCVITRIKRKRKQKLIREWRQMQREISIQSDVQHIQRQQQEVNTIAKSFDQKSIESNNVVNVDRLPSTSDEEQDNPPTYSQINQFKHTAIVHDQF